VCTGNPGSRCEDTKCHNRALNVECGANCAAGQHCANRYFTHPLVKERQNTLKVFRTQSRGFGLRTEADVFAGQFVIEYIGEVITKEECSRRLKDCQARGYHTDYPLLSHSTGVIMLALWHYPHSGWQG
jgi:SET domain-containing protein